VVRRAGRSVLIRRNFYDSSGGKRTAELRMAFCVHDKKRDAVGAEPKKE